MAKRNKITIGSNESTKDEIKVEPIPVKDFQEKVQVVTAQKQIQTGESLIPIVKELKAKGLNNSQIASRLMVHKVIIDAIA